MANRTTAQRAYRVEASKTSDEATIYLYDIIGYDWWSGEGITAKQFAKDLNAITASKIHLRFNTPGGDVFEARAMVTAIQQHKATIVAHIDGLAASAGSFIAVNCSEVEITEGAFLMIHNGWTLAMGDRHAMLECAALLEQIDGSIVDDYKRKTGKSADDLAAMMDAETWINAKDAVSMGFADRVAQVKAGSEKDSSKARARWNLSAFGAAPDELMPPEAVADDAAEQAAKHAERRRRLALLSGGFV